MIKNNDNSKFRTAFGQLAFATNRYICSHLKHLVDDFEMDLEMAFVFNALSQLNMSDGLNPHVHKNVILNVDSQPLLKPVRLRDVVGLTSLPRETVRRKLHRLLSDGKVCRPSDGLWCVNPDVLTAKMDQHIVVGILGLLHTAEELQMILELSD